MGTSQPAVSLSYTVIVIEPLTLNCLSRITYYHALLKLLQIQLNSTVGDQNSPGFFFGRPYKIALRMPVFLYVTIHTKLLAIVLLYTIYKIAYKAFRGGAHQSFVKLQLPHAQIQCLHVEKKYMTVECYVVGRVIVDEPRPTGMTP